MKLFEAQIQGDIDLEHLIIAEMIDEFGTEEKVRILLAQYAEYEKSVNDYQSKVEEDEEASVDFQRLQEQKKLEQERIGLLKLFDEMD